MQAITTYYMPATNTRQARMKATCVRGSLVLPYEYGATSEGNHRIVAYTLLRRFIEEDTRDAAAQMEAKGMALPSSFRSAWDLPMVSGHIRNNQTVWVLCERIRELTGALRPLIEVAEQQRHGISASVHAEVIRNAKLVISA